MHIGESRDKKIIQNNLMDEEQERLERNWSFGQWPTTMYFLSSYTISFVDKIAHTIKTNALRS